MGAKLKVTFNVGVSLTLCQDDYNNKSMLTLLTKRKSLISKQTTPKTKKRRNFNNNKPLTPKNRLT